MAISYQHPKVKVHVGDGFKFLDDYKNEFDVIITDSSDPEGPAESLFQKPYFELLFGALREGGVITTQGCTFSFVTNGLVSLDFGSPNLYFLPLAKPIDPYYSKFLSPIFVTFLVFLFSLLKRVTPANLITQLRTNGSTSH